MSSRRSRPKFPFGMRVSMSPSQRYDRIAFVASAGTEAQQALTQLTSLYGNCEPAEADIVVALGGDGLMLQTLHRNMRSGKPIYGMHRGTVGFLMNEFATHRAESAAGRGARVGDPSAADARHRRARQGLQPPCHQRGRAVPPDLSGGALAHPDRRARADAGTDRRRHPGGNAGRDPPPTICRRRDRSCRSTPPCSR